MAYDIKPLREVIFIISPGVLLFNREIVESWNFQEN